MKNIIYFLYYIKKLKFRKFRKFLKIASRQTQRSQLAILLDAINSTFKYKIGLIDYFYFRFFEKSSTERATYAGTGYMYEYHLKMNPPSSRVVLKDKLQFLQKFSDYVNHDYSTLNDHAKENLEKIIRKPSGKFVLKSSDGQCGEGVEVLKSEGLTVDKVLNIMKQKKLDLIEDFLVQHPTLMELSPAGLNTIRIFTQLDRNKNVKILGARLRITVNSHIDNLAAGNLAAPIVEDTGKIIDPAVYSDISKPRAISVHPITNKHIVGFKVPFWNEALEMVKEAALSMPENKSIGWDIAITEKGPELLEGNHNWCKLLWQLPVNKGMKEVLKSYLHEKI